VSALSDELGDPWAHAAAATGLAKIAAETGDRTASMKLEDALALHRALDHRDGITTTLNALETLASAHDDDAAAGRWRQELNRVREEAS
jgi:hypothetical protein